MLQESLAAPIIEERRPLKKIRKLTKSVKLKKEHTAAKI